MEALPLSRGAAPVAITGFVPAGGAAGTEVVLGGSGFSTDDPADNVVSLAQISVAGIAGYTVAVFGLNNTGVHGFGWPFWVLVPFATLIAAIVVFAADAVLHRPAVLSSHSQVVCLDHLGH